MNPSLTVPSEARYFESGLKRRACTPKLCSDIIVTGLSDDSSARQNMAILGLYPVSPSASHLPLGLSATDVAALTRSSPWSTCLQESRTSRGWKPAASHQHSVLVHIPRHGVAGHRGWELRLHLLRFRLGRVWRGKSVASRSGRRWWL